MSSLPSARSSPGTPPWVVPIRSPRERLTLSPLYRFHAPLLFRMRCAQVWELPQDVGVGLEARGRTLIFRQEGDAVIDHVVGEDPAVGILCGLRRIETQHVGKRALLVDRGDRFLARVIAGMPHQMHELVEPSLAVVDGLARVVFLLGVIGVEEAANARMTRAIDV